MTELYFNPLAIDTLREKWYYNHSSKISKFKDLAKALRYDLFVKNPYDLIVGNSKNVIFNKTKSEVEKIAAAAIVIISFIYINLIYSFFIYSFVTTIHTLSVFSGSEKLIQITSSVKAIGNRLILMWTKPAKAFLYKIPKNLLSKLPQTIKIIIDKVCSVWLLTLNSILLPFLRVIKKVLFWNQVQLILAARMVFDKISDIYNFIYQNIILPFWVGRIKPQVDQFYMSVKGIKPLQSYLFA